MKVPHSVVGRTQPSTLGRAYMDDGAAQGIAQAGAAIGAGLAAIGGRLDERQKKTERFKALTDFSSFESQTALALAEMKRNTKPGEGNFAAQAGATFDREAAKFLSTLPPDLQDEFQYRNAEFRKKLIADSMDFQYKQQDAFYRHGIDEEFQKAKTALDPTLGGDPAQLEAQRARVYETIDASDLADLDKEDLKTKIAIGLEGVTYKEAVKDAAKAVARGGAGAYELIRSEEGFRTDPYWDVNALRTGYGSDTVTRADGSVEPVNAGTRITREDAERDLKRRVDTEFGPRAKSQIGEREWGALSGNARAALISVTYNYGSLPNSVVQAAKTGDPESIARAVENLSANPGRRKREAAIIRGGGEPVEDVNIDDDPRFANLSYEDRLAARADAEREVAQENAALSAAQKAAYDAKLNTLLVGLHDGKMGQTAIDGARQSWLTDYDDINKAQNLLEEKDKSTALLRSAQEKLDSGAIWSPTDEDDKKMANALYGQRGPQALAAQDQGYVTTGLVPLVQHMGDIPTDAVGFLQGMARSNNPQKMLFAYNTLAMLQDAAPEAFDARVPESVARDVQYWRDRKDVVTEEELAAGLKGGNSQQERQARKILREEGLDFLSQKVDGIPRIKGLVDAVVGDMDVSWSRDPNVSDLPWAAIGLERDFRTAFIDEYERRGNVDEATAAATKSLQRQWGVSGVGGQDNLMKFPPEKVGYPKILGSYDWMTAQARQELGITQGPFQLLSDNQTRDEVLGYKRGGPAPSYTIVVTDDKGVSRLLLDDNGAPRRIFFEPTEVHKAAEQIDFRLKQIDSQILEADHAMQRAAIIARRNGEIIPSEYQERLEELSEERYEVGQQLERAATAGGLQKPRLGDNPAVKKRVEDIVNFSREQRPRNKPWIIFNENSAVGPFYPPWDPETPQDVEERRRFMRSE